MLNVFSIQLSSGKIFRRCDEQGNWQEMNISNCRRLTQKEAVEKGKQAANIPSEERASLTIPLLNCNIFNGELY